MYKKIFLLQLFCLVFLFVNTVFAQKAAVKFLKSSVPYSYSSSSVMGVATAIDKNSNSFSVGTVWTNGNDTLSFGSVTVASNGILAGYVAKYSPNGDAKWVKLITSLDSTSWYDQIWINRVAVDDSGNCYITGNHHNTIVIGTDSIKDTGGFLTKIDSNGNYKWSKRIGGTGYYNSLESFDIKFDTKGNIYVGGNYDDGNTSPQYLDTTFIAQHGLSDNYIAKFSSAGKLLWYKTFGDPVYSDIYNGFTIDKDNNIYFNGSEVKKLDSSGNVIHANIKVRGFGVPAYSSYENCLYTTFIFGGKIRVKNSFVLADDYKLALAKYDTALNLIDITTVTEDYDYFTSDVTQGVTAGVVLDKDFNPIVFGRSDAYGAIDDADTVFNKNGDNDIMFFGKFDKNLAPVWFEEFEGSFYTNKIDIAAHPGKPLFSVSGTYFGKLKYHQDSVVSYMDTMFSETESMYIGLLQDKDVSKGLVTILGAKYICKAGTAEYKVKHTPGNSYKWTIIGGKILSTKTDTNTISVKWDSVGTQKLMLQQKYASGKLANDTVRVHVYNNPKASIKGDTIVCRGSTTKYTAANTGKYTYEWFLKNKNNATNFTQDTFSISWNDTGYNEIKLVQGVPFSCKDSSTIRIYVVDTPKISINGKTAVCYNSTTQYWVSRLKNHTYKWNISGGKLLTANNKDTITVLWDSVGTHQISIDVFNPSGCKGSALIKVNVNPLPVPKITGKVTVCRDKPALFQTSPSITSFYNWYAKNGTLSTTQNTYFIYAAWKDTGLTYIKLVENTYTGCKDSVMLEVYVSDTPNPVIMGPDTLCNEQIGIYITPQERDVAIDWQVFGGIVLAGRNNDTLVVRWKVPGSNVVKLTKTNALGCQYARAIPVQVQNLPIISISGNANACRGRTSLFTANTKDTTYLTWTVKGGEITKGQSTDSIIVQWKDTTFGEVKLLALNRNGCKDSSIFSVKLDPVVQPKFGFKDVCFGENVQFKDSSIVQSGYTYEWSFGDGNTSTLTSPTHKYTSPGKYKVSLKITGKCSDSLTKTVTVFPLPTVPKISKNGDSLLSTFAAKYQWYKNGNPISGAVKKYFIPYANGAYKVAVSDSVGCTSVSSEINVHIKDTLTGTVTQFGGQPLKNTKIYLLKIDFKDTVLSIKDSAVTDNNGKYTFALNDSLVFLMAAPNASTNPNELPTYFDTSLTIGSATYIYLKQGTNIASWSTANGTNAGGNGLISGKVKLCKNCKKEEDGEPVNRLKLILINEDNKPVEITYTNTEGAFAFTNIALGKYKIWVDKLLIDNNNKAPVLELTAQKNQQKDLTFILYNDQLVLDTSAIINSVKYNAAQNSLRVYPNPFVTAALVKFDLKNEENVNIILTDMNGRNCATLANGKLKAGEHSYIIQKEKYQLKPGIYLLRFTSESNSITEKIIMQ